MNSVRLQHRPSRSVPALIVALVLLVIGGGSAWIGFSEVATGSWDAGVQSVAGSATSLTWQSSIAVGTFVAAVLVGVVLFVAAVRPGAPSTVALRVDSAPTRAAEAALGRRSLARLAADRAARVVGVSGVWAGVRGRQLLVNVTTPSDQIDPLRSAVADAVRAAVAEVGVQTPPNVRVSARTRR